MYDHHGEDRAIDLARIVYRALFVDDINIGEPTETMKAVDAMDIDGTMLNAGANSQQIRDQPEAEIDLVMSRGASGPSYVIVDDGALWGFGRFDQIETLLRDERI